MSYWNHRVVAFEDPEFGEVHYGIHEVYYDDEGAIEFWTESPVDVSAESREGLVSVLAQMTRATEKPVLWREGDDLEEEPT